MKLVYETVYAKLRGDNTIDVSHGVILTEKEKLQVLAMKSLFLILEIAKVQPPSCVSRNKRLMVYLWSCNDQSLRFNDESLVLRIGAGQLSAGQVTRFYNCWAER